MIEWLQTLADGTSPALQWLVIMFAGAIPFVESYFGSVLGVLAGVSVPLAIAAAVVGNWLSMFLLVAFGDKINARRKPKEPTRRQERFRAMFNKYGVAGVSLLGQTILPSQITSLAMVALGTPRQAVVFWQTISIILWGTAFGLLAAGGVNLMQG
ncbi:hypothetical protein ACQ7DA_08720 [Zafaria sp. J156]|uniref:hypothetical protein n=1 Tax=Zafaria sp. J156 TaxID=3116490 RepID=UPI002E76485D|nr:hypothetical protein [Zafaria sp. J156]MEE1621280.1 hypothetical protein [Zafaria sp. J156]